MAGSAGVWSRSHGAAADRGRALVVGWARAAPGQAGERATFFGRAGWLATLWGGSWF